MLEIHSKGFWTIGKSVEFHVYSYFILILYGSRAKTTHIKIEAIGCKNTQGG